MKKKALRMASWFIASILTLLLFAQPASAATDTSGFIKNGTAWLDTSGKSIQAHGGGFLKYGDYYYWVGEDKSADSALFHGINLYRSKNLKDWEFVHQILSVQTKPDLNGKKVERPKLIYNKKTDTFVLWGHWELGESYAASHLLVATSKTIDGDYKVVRNFRPGAGEVETTQTDPTYTGTDKKYGYGSRDFTVYNDADNNTAYLISAQNSQDMRVYKLTDDYTNVDWKNSYPLFVGKKREAPALIKAGRYYYLFTSSQSGWYPNQAMVSYTDNISDPNSWSALKPVGNNSTFYSQPTNIMEIAGSGGTRHYVYMGDRWNPAKLGSSQYIWLPVTFSGTSVTMNYVNAWQLTDKGTIQTSGDRLLSENKPVSGSEAAANHALDLANDGNDAQALGVWDPSSAYMPKNVPFEWQVDLGQQEDLSRIDISFVSYNGSETYAQYQVYGSNDKRQWQLISDQLQNKTTSFRSDELSGSYRYVKVAVSKVINAHNNKDASWSAGLVEVQVYGKQNPAVALADSAVKKAEKSRAQADVDAARKLVNALPESSEKSALLKKLNAVEISANKGSEDSQTSQQEQPKSADSKQGNQRAANNQGKQSADKQGQKTHKSASPKSGLPITGDELNLWTMTLGAGLLLAGGAVMIFFKKRKRA